MKIQQRPLFSFALPIYVQIRDYFREKIVAGQLSPNTLLPSERAICCEFQVSRGTVRQALRELEQEGLIYHRDRVGYFVSPARLTYHLHEIASVTDELAGQGYVADALVISQALEAPSRCVREALRLDIGDAVVHIKRVRLASTRPVLLELLYLPARRFASLADRELNHCSLWQVLHDGYGVHFGHTELVVRMSHLDRTEAQLLDAAEHAPAFTVTRLIHTATGEPVEFSQEVYRADMAEFRSVAWPRATGYLPAATLDLRVPDRP